MEKLVETEDLGIGGNQEFSGRVTFDDAETKPGGDVGKAAGETNLSRLEMVISESPVDEWHLKPWG